MHFLPILRSIPIFGRRVADEWLWALNLSPGFFGQGIITGLAIPSHMFAGTVVGWAILAPLAKRKGWAPGPIEDWESGSRAWIMWISLSGLMADAVVNLIWLGFHPLYALLRPRTIGEQHLEINPSSPDATVQPDSDEDPSHAETRLLNSAPSRPTSRSKTTSGTRVTPSTTALLGMAFLVSTVICVIAVHVLFQSKFRWYYTLVATLLSLPMAVIGIRALAEADWNPNITLVSQLVFAALVPFPNPNALIVNLVSAALAAAGANQAGDIAYDFKIGQLVGANPDAQILGHIIGSFFGALISCVVYRLYTASYAVPGPLFGIPAAYLSVKIAKLVLGQDFPKELRLLLLHLASSLWSFQL